MVDGLRKKGAPHLDLVPEGRGYLLVDFGFDEAEETNQTAARFMEWARQLPGGPDVRRYSNAQARAMWRIREAGPRAAATAPGAPLKWEGWDDASVAPEKLRELSARSARAPGRIRVQDGLLRPLRRRLRPHAGELRLPIGSGSASSRRSSTRAADLVVATAARCPASTATGSRAVGCSRKCSVRELMSRLSRIQAIWDPDGKMNPHKIVDAPYPIVDPAPPGADFRAASATDSFRFPEDGGSIPRAIAPLRRRGRVAGRTTAEPCVPATGAPPRNSIQHARPRAPAVRDPAGRDDRRRLERARR